MSDKVCPGCGQVHDMTLRDKADIISAASAALAITLRNIDHTRHAGKADDPREMNIARQMVIKTAALLIDMGSDDLGLDAMIKVLDKETMAEVASVGKVSADVSFEDGSKVDGGLSDEALTQLRAALNDPNMSDTRH